MHSLITGGSNIIINQKNSNKFFSAGMLSKDGRCKTFDKEANGYVRSEGCGIALLKRMIEKENKRKNSWSDNRKCSESRWKK